jgi:hypothetical protein
MQQSGYAGLYSSIPPVPVHPHFADPVRFSLAENRSPSFDPFTGTPAPEHTFELGREPGPRHEDLAGAECDLRVIVGNLVPVAADRVGSPDGRSEGRLDEDGIGGVDRHQKVHVTAGPPSSEGVDQGAAQSAGGVGRILGSHALEITSLPEIGSAVAALFLIPVPGTTVSSGCGRRLAAERQFHPRGELL